MRKQLPLNIKHDFLVSNHIHNTQHEKIFEKQSENVKTFRGYDFRRVICDKHPRRFSLSFYLNNADVKNG